MADLRRSLRTTAKVAGVLVLGPAATVLAGLAGITSFAAYMDVHGVIVAMRIAVVAAVAVVLVPAAIGFCAWRFDRIEAKAYRRQLAALPGKTAAHTQSSSPARHRKVA